MSKTKFLIQLIISFLILSCSTAKSYKISIARLDSIHNYYLIYGLKDGYVYKIVSPKVMNAKYRNRIKVGKIYRFHVLPIIDNTIKFAPANFLDINCVAFTDTTKICIEDGCLPNLYYSNEIDGLYTSK